MRIVGGSRDPGQALCQAGSRTLSIEKMAKQVLERELTCVLRPFQLRSFQERREKTPFPIFDRNKSCGHTVMHSEIHPAARPAADVDSGSSGLGHIADVPAGRGRPVVPPSCFPEYFSQACMVMRGL